MAKHEVIVQENTGATKESAPYVLVYQKKADLAFDSICELVAKEAGFTDTLARTILEGAFGEFVALERDAAVRIHVDGMTIALAIKESLPSADAAFDPLVNKLTVNVYLDDGVKFALADVTPTIVTYETSTKVRITLVADEATPRPYDLIHGQYVFDVQGFNLVMTDTGASVTLIDSTGASYACTVMESVSKQLIRVKSATLLEGGDYTLVVKSRGGDAEGSLQTRSRKVKYLKVSPPEHAALTNLRTSAEDPAGDLSIADMVTLTFDKADPQGAKGKLLVNGVVQDGLITVSSPTVNIEWTWGREELIGQEVTFQFRYEDGTVSGEVKKTIREERE